MVLNHLINSHISNIIVFICSDDYPVYVSTQQNETHDNDNFQLTAGIDTLLLLGVLCENGMCLFQNGL